MGVIIRNATGSIFNFGPINNLSETKHTKTSIIKLPGANLDVIQRFGISNREFTLDGIITIAGGTSFLNNIDGGTGSITYSNPIEIAISTVTVLFYNLKYRDEGSRPMERRFSLEAVEII